MRQLILIIIVVFFSDCTNGEKSKVEIKKKILNISLASNPCDSASIVFNLLESNKKNDSASVEIGSKILYECGKISESIKIMQDNFNKKDMNQYVLARLCESYRILGNYDSSIHYLELWKEKEHSTYWNDSRIEFWKMQIEFDCKKYESSISTGLGIIPSIGELDSTELRILNEHIAFAYWELGQVEKYCAYAKINAPRIYSDSLCNVH